MCVHLKLFISLKTVCENSGILVLEIVEEDKAVKMLTFLLWKYLLDFQQTFRIFKPIRSGVRIHDKYQLF